MCWNKALTFGVGSIKVSFRANVFTQYIMHTKMFSIQMLLYTFQSNIADGVQFSALISSVILQFILTWMALTLSAQGLPFT